VGRPAWRTERIAARILGPVASPPSTRSTSDRRGGALDVAHAGAARSGEPRRTARRPERENNQTVAYALVGDDEPTAADAARCLSGRTFGGLTRREVEVLRLVALAHSNREIAAALVLSEKTVERPSQPHLRKAAGLLTHGSYPCRRTGWHRLTVPLVRFVYNTFNPGGSACWSCAITAGSSARGAPTQDRRLECSWPRAVPGSRRQRLRSLRIGSCLWPQGSVVAPVYSPSQLRPQTILPRRTSGGG